MPQQKTEAPKVEELQTTESNREDTVTQPESESDIQIRLHKAQMIVKNHIVAVMGASLVPIPLVDLVALMGIQLKMLHSLTKLYEVPFQKNIGKNLIASLIGGVLPTTTAVAVASIAKTIPGLGTAAGVASVSILGGAITYGIGNAFIQHFETGGNLLNFDPEKMQQYFARKMKEGKDVAAELNKDKDADKDTTKDS